MTLVRARDDILTVMVVDASEAVRGVVTWWAGCCRAGRRLVDVGGAEAAAVFCKGVVAQGMCGVCAVLLV